MQRNREAANLALVILLILLVPLCAAAQEWKETKQLSKRQRIDEVAEETLEELFDQSEKAELLFRKAHGWAVFDNLKIAFGLSGGAGNGVAVERGNGKRTYMKMGTGGIGLGLGGQKFQVVFLFEDRITFADFVDNGWIANTSAHAVAGTAGANTGATFTNGLAVFQLTHKGLMLQADIAGTRYWQNKKLNRRRR